MSSKLFHTVVAFGISLGAAASVGCAAEPVDEAGQSEAAQTASEEKAAPEAVADRFCEVAWPTTKGGPRPADAQMCIDPRRECGAYPGPDFGIGETCIKVTSTGTCDPSAGRFWLICKTGEDGPQWECPTGSIRARSCTSVQPEEEATP